MNVLVVGPYPPALGNVAANTVKTVAEYLDAGEKVLVVSPEPSAAHDHRNMSGVMGVFNVVRYRRSFEKLVVQFDAGMFVRPRTGRISRTADCFALGYLLKSFKYSELRFSTLDAMPKSVGGRAAQALWKSANHIVVANENDRLLLESAGGCDPDKISVQSKKTESSRGSMRSTVEVVPWDDVSVDAETVQAQIIARADLDRNR